MERRELKKEALPVVAGPVGTLVPAGVSGICGWVPEVVAEGEGEGDEGEDEGHG